MVLILKSVNGEMWLENVDLPPGSKWNGYFIWFPEEWEDNIHEFTTASCKII